MRYRAQVPASPMIPQPPFNLFYSGRSGAGIVRSSMDFKALADRLPTLRRPAILEDANRQVLGGVEANDGRCDDRRVKWVWWFDEEPLKLKAVVKYRLRVRRRGGWKLKPPISEPPSEKLCDSMAEAIEWKDQLVADLGVAAPPQQEIDAGRRAAYVDSVSAEPWRE